MFRSSRRRDLSRVTALALLLLAVSAACAGLGVARGSSPGRGAVSCSDIEFIGARGSGESEHGYDGMGRSVSLMASRLRDDLRQAGLDMRTLPVVYTAASVAVLNPSRAEIAGMLSGVPAVAAVAAAHYYGHHVRPYLASLAEGTAQTITEARALQSSCPDTGLVFGGYSQGAMAIHQAQVQLRHRNQVNLLQAFAGTLFLGDGDRVPKTRAHLFGTAGGHGEGIRTYLHGIARHDVEDPGFSAEICNAGDLVCDFNLHTLENHGRGASVHTSYAGRHGQLLRSAVDWLARRLVLRFPSNLYGGTADVLGFYEVRPDFIKFGSGEGWNITTWNGWGKPTATGLGRYNNHQDVSVAGTVTLSHPRQCGAYRVYTLFTATYDSDPSDAGYTPPSRVSIAAACR